MESSCGRDITQSINEKSRGGGGPGVVFLIFYIKML